jgi:hypothetical protein
MWKILLSNPLLMGLLVFYMLTNVVVLIFATLTRDRKPPCRDGRPCHQVDYQAFWSNGPRRSRVESDRRFSPVQDSSCVDLDQRLRPAQYWCSSVYARMFADASERIRL